VLRFDNITLASYQITDNQKTSLRITKEGKVLNRSRYDYTVFEDGLNDFSVFDELNQDEKDWVPDENSPFSSYFGWHRAVI